MLFFTLPIPLFHHLLLKSLVSLFETFCLQIFTNDKFLLTASPAALRSLISIAEKLIIDPSLVSQSGKEVAHVDRWFRAVAVALTSGSNGTRWVSNLDLDLIFG